jgi:hypothetical protein
MSHANAITGCQDDGWSNAHDVKIDISGMVIEEFKQTLVEQIVKSNFYKVISGKALPEYLDVEGFKLITARHNFDFDPSCYLCKYLGNKT